MTVTTTKDQGGSVDRTLIRVALRRTPRQRLEAAMDLYRFALRLRSGRWAGAPRTNASTLN